MKNLSNNLEGKRIIITGCGYKPEKTIFYDIVTKQPSHTPMEINGERYKLNIGAATALILARRGATVHLVSHAEEKLKNLQQFIIDSVGCTPNKVEYSVVDLLDSKQVKNFVASLSTDKPIYWVQSVGLGAGSYKLKDDNPYLPIEEIDLSLLEQETTIVIKATHIMTQALLPLFKKQPETRIAIVSSMSAIRGYALGITHCAAKGAIDRYANATMLALYKNNIFVTTIRPGIVDTGMYDNQTVQKAAIKLSDEYGGVYNNKRIFLAPPTTVGDAIAYALETDAHIPSINLVAKGQCPHEGS